MHRRSSRSCPPEPESERGINGKRMIGAVVSWRISRVAGKGIETDEISPERGKAHLDASEINCDDDVAPSVSMAVAAATNADSERSRP